MTLRDVMRPLDDLHSVTPDTPLMNALQAMITGDLNQLPVVTGNHLKGVLSRAQLLGYLQTRSELKM
jgi:CBS domain-containing protein